MSYSFAETASTVFTVTHARHMAAKVATDLKRVQRFYGSPDDARIARLEAKVVELLKHGVLGTVAYGFQRGNQWIEPMLKYTARDLAGMAANDDDPGRVRPGANIAGATFYSYLTHNATWYELSQGQREQIERALPFQRSGADEPGVNGYFITDRTYSSGGRALDRASLRSA